MNQIIHTRKIHPEDARRLGPILCSECKRKLRNRRATTCGKCAAELLEAAFSYVAEMYESVKVKEV